MLGHVPAHAPGWMGNRLTVSIFRGTREPRIPCADHVLAHAGTCWHMLAHASPCGHILVRILAHASTCWHMPAHGTRPCSHPGTCQHMLAHASPEHEEIHCLYKDLRGLPLGHGWRVARHAGHMAGHAGHMAGHSGHMAGHARHTNRIFCD